MNSRREFLGTLGKALGTGSLLLPLAGKGALALPADLGPAAHLPVSERALPLPPACLELRRIKYVLAHVHAEPHSRDRSLRWKILAERYESIARDLASKPAASWSDCVALAEIAWHMTTKEEIEGPDGFPVYTGELEIGRQEAIRNPWAAPCSAWWHHVQVALIEAVLSLGGGERFDPKIG
jgi:hypothetical protein